MDNDDRAKITAAAHALAAAIAQRDEQAISGILASDFILRCPGKASVGALAFIAGVRGIPAEIVFVRLEDVEVDVAGQSALVTGNQRSQYRVNGETLDEVRPFVDLFVRGDSGDWRLRIAMDLTA